MNQLAIIIPYYKIDFFEETIQSVIAQTDKRFTLYIGNDASPNDPKPILDKYLKPNEYKYFNYKENLGAQNLALQWERILENVTEEWFQILGDDDVISNNFVEEFYSNSDNFHNVNVVKTASHIINENKIIIYNKSDNYTSGYHNICDLFFDKLYGKINSSLSEHIFRKSALLKEGFKKYPLAWHSDDFALLSLSKEKENLYFITTTKVYIKETRKSISGTKDNTEQKRIASIVFFLDTIKLFKQEKEITQLNNLVYYLVNNKHNLITKSQVYVNAYAFPQSIIKYGLHFVRYFIYRNKFVLDFKNKLKKVKYIVAKRTNKTIINQISDPTTIPIIIINYNQLFYLEQQIIFFTEREFKNIIIIDNNSSYPPLLEYYKTIETKVKIERMPTNQGFDVFFKTPHLLKKYAQGYFFLTDSDIIPNKNLPTNFVEIMISYLDKYFSDITKVGFALDIDNIPDYYPLREKVRIWEHRFWEQEVEDKVYKVLIDTTFALYKPYYKPLTRKTFIKGLRLGGDFTALHGGWYLDPQNLTDEQKYYIKTANSSSSWKIDEKGNHTSTEYDESINQNKPCSQ